MVDHKSRNKHGLINNKKKTTSMTIPGSPFVKQRQHKKIETVNKPTEHVTPKVVTPKRKASSQSTYPMSTKSERSFSVLSSPASIILGYEHHGEVTPVKKDLMNLFGPPVKVVSPLPATPKKQRLDSEESFIVIEDETLKEDEIIVNSVVAEKKSAVKRRDNSHLALPNKTSVEAGKKWHRFVSPPSLFKETEEAKVVQKIRTEAISSSTYQGSVLPYGYGSVRKK